MYEQQLSRRQLIKTTGIVAGTAIATQALPTMSAQSRKDGVATPLINTIESAPTAEKVPLVMKLLKEKPLELADELRASRPIMKVGDILLVAKYVDVVEVLSHPTVFTVKLYKPKMGDFMLTHDETPTHFRDKAVMSAMLPQSDGARIRQMVSGYVADAVKSANGRIEIVSQWGRKVPTRLVQEYFGLDGIEPDTLKRWSYWAQLDNFHNHSFQSRPNSDELAARAAKEKKELVEYAAALVKRRGEELRNNPDKDDVVSRMLKSQLPPSLGFGPERIVLNTVGLLIGSVETTSHALVHVVDELLRRPSEMSAVTTFAGQNDFNSISLYVWEASRFAPISSYMFRLCEKPFTIAKGTDRETAVTPQTTVLVLTQSASFDPVEFAAPTEFRTDRPEYQSFLFGFGYHRCLGEYVAREMMPEMVRALFTCRNLRRAEGAEGQINYKDGPFPESMTLVFDT